MMDAVISLLSVVWMGILASLSPCPLATNIAAVSFLAREAESPKRVMYGGVAYALGRIVSLIALAAIILLGFASSPLISGFLQKYMNLFLGPMLVLVAAVLLDLVSLPRMGISTKLDKLLERLQKVGLIGSFALGLILALVFCPSSGAVYFGGLLPLAEAKHHQIIYPLVFGLMTALPVIAITIALALGLKGIGKAFSEVKRLESYIRKITGGVILILGIMKSLQMLGV